MYNIALIQLSEKDLYMHIDIVAYKKIMRVNHSGNSA